MSAVIQPDAGHPAHAAPVTVSELVAGADARPLAFDGNGVVSAGQFRAEVRALAATLPAARHVINLCEDRYRFLVAFCAALARGQATLLPSSRAPAVVAALLATHPGAHCLADGPVAGLAGPVHVLPDPLPRAPGPLPPIADDTLAAIGYTSGSTGQPGVNPKPWGGFRAGTVQNLAALADLLHPDAVTPLVATVPPQHMYGMELSVLLPMLGPVAVYRGRPFFPSEVARALAQAARPPLLVTTPVHLRALVASTVALPPLAGIVSATAPLAPELAAAAEDRYGCELREVFGSTETCVIARRRTARDPAWRPLPGVRLAPRPDGTAVHAPHLAQPVVLADLMELRPDGCFELRGRCADLLEIAGKRASLGDLTRRLLAVPGVVDGVVLQLDGADAAGVRRIGALAVAPGLAPAAILDALRVQVDPVFLPRRLRCVEALPRNPTGKLPRAALLELLQA